MGVRHTPELAVASLTGIAAGYAHLHRLDRAEALAEIRGVLDGCRFTSVQAVEKLSQAAALYVHPPPAWSWWAADAHGLLVEAGADPDRARQLAVPRRRAWWAPD
jgi:hypothetical protein